MTKVRLTPRAQAELDDIYDHTAERWGVAQATLYTDGLIAAFDGIARGSLPSKRVPVTFGVQGFYRRCEHHFIYWRPADDAITIVAILHERMNQVERLKDEPA